jgi:hypothetical protein
MRGAQIEITNWLGGQGYKAIDRWSAVESTSVGTAALSTPESLTSEPDMIRHFR